MDNQKRAQELVKNMWGFSHDDAGDERLSKLEKAIERGLDEAVAEERKRVKLLARALVKMKRWAEMDIVPVETIDEYEQDLEDAETALATVD